MDSCHKRNDAKMGEQGASHDSKDESDDNKTMARYKLDFGNMGEVTAPPGLHARPGAFDCGRVLFGCVYVCVSECECVRVCVCACVWICIPGTYPQHA